MSFLQASFKILFFCMVISSHAGSAYTLLPCFSERNVTIIPCMNFPEYFRTFLDKLYQGISSQVMYLVQYLLDTPCFTVWVFSPIQSRVIRMSEENYINFFQTEFQAIDKTDSNDVVRVLSNIPRSNGGINQTLFFLSFYSFYNATDSERSVVDEVKNIYESKYSDIVMWCSSTLFCLPNTRHSIRSDPVHHKFNPHLHQIFVDLMHNPNYDWRERYKRHRSTCEITKNIHVYFWHRLPISPVIGIFYLFIEEYITGLLPNTTLHLIQKPAYWSTFDKVTYSAVHQNHTIQSNQTDQQIKDWYRENAEKTDIDIHILVYDHTTDYKTFFPIEEEETTIHVIFNNTITESPLLENEKIQIWEEDYLHPFFFKMLIEMIDSFRCL
uniref:Cnidarian restricted protein n=1 Tax=Clytia hemisphaerica TaxID=252671 RepID=A0A7M6DRY8_9CNID|eukprot:TCONS_00042816-protein